MSGRIFSDNDFLDRGSSAKMTSRPHRVAERCRREMRCAPGSTFQSASSRCSHKIIDTDQIVDGGGKGEHPASALESLMSGLAHETDCLEPAENLFNNVALPLAGFISLMARGSTINGAAFDLLCYMRSDLLDSELLDKILDVIAFVGSKGYSARFALTSVFAHGESCLALGHARGPRVAGVA